ncbi:uncharacterized protein LOC129601089 [Paramacrobiotus metropolitanus]|uniref:uncharacterized protein LOC129601089 n=1 Tax=Paramacrobiotus metropolitanus TaxID=2943436 RepID=UPI00244601BC|nr:uncharacterized protein LOC129601089 [Paramacrobiotus metropolitanus]
MMNLDDVTAVALTESARKLDTGEASSIQLKPRAPGTFQLKRTSSAPGADYNSVPGPRTTMPVTLSALQRFFSLPNRTPPARHAVKSPDSRRGLADSPDSNRIKVDIPSQPAPAASACHGTNINKISSETSVTGQCVENVRRPDEQYGNISSKSTENTVSGGEVEIKENKYVGITATAGMGVGKDPMESNKRRTSVPLDVVTLNVTIKADDQDLERPPRPDVVPKTENLIKDDGNALHHCARLPMDYIAIVNENDEAENRTRHPIPHSQKRSDSHLTFDKQAHNEHDRPSADERTIATNHSTVEVDFFARKAASLPQETKAINSHPISKGEMITQL